MRRLSDSVQSGGWTNPRLVHPLVAIQQPCHVGGSVGLVPGVNVAFRARSGRKMSTSWPPAWPAGAVAWLVSDGD